MLFSLYTNIVDAPIHYVVFIMPYLLSAMTPSYCCTFLLGLYVFLNQWCYSYAALCFLELTEKVYVETL